MLEYSLAPATRKKFQQMFAYNAGILKPTEHQVHFNKYIAKKQVYLLPTISSL